MNDRSESEEFRSLSPELGDVLEAMPNERPGTGSGPGMGWGMEGSVKNSGKVLAFGKNVFYRRL